MLHTFTRLQLTFFYSDPHETSAMSEQKRFLVFTYYIFE